MTPRIIAKPLLQDYDLSSGVDKPTETAI